jgi:hypothetical protein
MTAGTASRGNITSNSRRIANGIQGEVVQTCTEPSYSSVDVFLVRRWSIANLIYNFAHSRESLFRVTEGVVGSTCISSLYEVKVFFNVTRAGDITARLTISVLIDGVNTSLRMRIAGACRDKWIDWVDMNRSNY